MRAGVSTDDYVDFGGKRYTILDTSPNRSVTCGTCTGCGTYRREHEDRISYSCVLEIRDNRLLLSNERIWSADWRSTFDSFTKNEISGVTLPYTGWLLLLDDWLGPYGDKASGILASTTVMEVHLAEGIVNLVHDSSALMAGLMKAAVAATVSAGRTLDRRGMPDCQIVVSMAAEYLVGSYHFMASDQGRVAKHERWGYYDGGRIPQHECAMCRALLERGLVPLRRPKKPRKKRYRTVAAPIGMLPIGFQKLALSQGCFGLASHGDCLQA